MPLPYSVAVTHIMEPAPAGRFAVLTVGGADASTKLFAHRLPDTPSAKPGEGDAKPIGEPIELTIVQREGETFTVDLPGEGACWAIDVSARYDADRAWRLNRPRIDWAMPGSPRVGERLTLYGRNFIDVHRCPAATGLEPRSYGVTMTGVTRVVAKSLADGSAVEWPVNTSTMYEAHLNVPASTKPGRYELYVHHGRGGAAGWSDPLTIEFAAADAWPTAVYRVDEHMAAGMNADDAIAAAVGAAEKAGGGVVLLGPRNYFITRTIVMPPRTVLRGSGVDRTRVMLPKEGEGEKPPYVGVTGDRDFIVEQMRLESVYAAVLVAAPTFLPQSFDEAFRTNWPAEAGRASNVIVRDCELYMRPEAHQNRRGRNPVDRQFLDKMNVFLKDAAAREEGFHCVKLRGDDLQVLDSKIMGAGGGIGLNRCTHTRIAGNDISAGVSQSAILCFSRLKWPEGGGGAKVKHAYCQQIAIEDNDITAHAVRARNLIALLYSMEDCHVARNNIHDIEPTHDAEALLTHLWNARWKDPRLEMIDATTGRIIDPTNEVTNECLEGACIDIVEGRGIGQVRRIIKSDGDMVTLDRPWRVNPDADSMTVFTSPAPFSRMTFVDNDVVSTAINIIVWGNACDTIIDGNYTAEGPGITVWSIRLQADQKVWGGCAFTSITNNVVDRGWSSPAEKDALDGATGIMMFGTRAGDAATDGYDFLGLVIRDNVVRNNSGIGVRVSQNYSPAPGERRGWMMNYAGITVESNHCVDTVVGIAIEQGARVAERNNTAVRTAFPLLRATPSTALLD